MACDPPRAAAVLRSPWTALRPFAPHQYDASRGRNGRRFFAPAARRGRPPAGGSLSAAAHVGRVQRRTGRNCHEGKNGCHKDARAPRTSRMPARRASRPGTAPPGTAASRRTPCARVPPEAAAPEQSSSATSRRRGRFPPLGAPRPHIPQTTTRRPARVSSRRKIFSDHGLPGSRSKTTRCASEALQRS